MTTSTQLIAFPHETLTPIIGKPTNKNLRLLNTELVANALSVTSTRWGGESGHVGLVLNATDYLELAGVAFDGCDHPGPLHVQVPGQTAHQFAQLNKEYDIALRDFLLFETTRNRLRQQIIAAVDPMYLDELRQPTLGLARVSIRNMLEHLDTNYGKITGPELEANRAALLDAWSPDQPIQSLWNKHKEIREFAQAGGEPISDRVLMEQTIVLLHNVGHGKFQFGLDSWRLRAAADKTYANFKTHFTEENENIQHNLTTGAAGFHQTNAVTATGSASADNANKFEAVIGGKMKMYYCWSHGLGKNPAHTSRTCNKPHPGHVNEATMNDPDGGSQLMHIGGRRPPRAANAATSA